MHHHVTIWIRSELVRRTLWRTETIDWSCSPGIPPVVISVWYERPALQLAGVDVWAAAQAVGGSRFLAPENP